MSDLFVFKLDLAFVTIEGGNERCFDLFQGIGFICVKLFNYT